MSVSSLMKRFITVTQRIEYTGSVAPLQCPGGALASVADGCAPVGDLPHCVCSRLGARRAACGLSLFHQRTPSPLSSHGVERALVAAQSRFGCSSTISSSMQSTREGEEVVKMPDLPALLFIFFSECRLLVNLSTWNGL